MLRIYKLLIIAFTFPCQALLNADTWTRTYGGTDYDGGYSVQQTFDGGFIIAGETSSFGAGSYDVYLVKTNSSGDTLWTKTFGGIHEDRGWSVQQTSDSGFIIAGYTRSFEAGDADVYLLKTNSSGNTLWTRTFGGTADDLGYSVQQTSDGGFIIAGFTESFGAGFDDVYLIKTDSLGFVGTEENVGAIHELPKLDICPNPFITSTTIRYSVPDYTNTRLTIHDISGRLVKSLYSGIQKQGSHTLYIDSKDLTGGIYFIRLNTDTFSSTQKLILLF